MKKRGQSNNLNTKKKTISPKEEKKEETEKEAPPGEKEKGERDFAQGGGGIPHPPLWHHHQPLAQPRMIPRSTRQTTPLPALTEEDRERIAEGVYSDLVTEVLEEICLEVHKRVKTGNFCLECGVDNFSPSLPPVPPGRDIFGDVMKGSNSMEVLQCPNCNRSVTSVRFVPHLEKCLGLGRTSSRLATRRIAAMRVDPGRGMEDNDRRKRKRQRGGFEETTNSRRSRRTKEENDDDYEDLDGEDDLDELDDPNPGDEPYAPPMKRNKTRPTTRGGNRGN